MKFSRNAKKAVKTNGKAEVSVSEQSPSEHDSDDDASDQDAIAESSGSEEKNDRDDSALLVPDKPQRPPSMRLKLKRAPVEMEVSSTQAPCRRPKRTKKEVELDVCAICEQPGVVSDCDTCHRWFHRLCGADMSEEWPDGEQFTWNCVFCKNRSKTKSTARKTQQMAQSYKMWIGRFALSAHDFNMYAYRSSVPVSMRAVTFLLYRRELPHHTGAATETEERRD